ESIRALRHLAIAQGQMHQSHPRVRHGLVITFLQIVNRRTRRCRQSLKTSADFSKSLDERISAQIEVSDLDVVAMMKLLNRACFKRSEKLVVVHGVCSGSF